MLYRFGGELITGFLLGSASGCVVGLVAFAWLGHLRLAVCLLGGISGGVAAAAGFGLAMPFLLRLLRREPQVAAGPIALAVADMLTLLLYFNLARWLLADDLGLQAARQAGFANSSPGSSRFANFHGLSLRWKKMGKTE